MSRPKFEDSIETQCSPPATFQKFLTKLWPVFKKILEGKPDFSPTSFEPDPAKPGP